MAGKKRGGTKKLSVRGAPKKGGRGTLKVQQRRTGRRGR